jgi:fatty acid desaturase
MNIQILIIFKYIKRMWKHQNKPMRRVVKIHNKYYDITNFDHPGGLVAIMAANRRDATALYESHHPFSDREMMDAVLKKYEMHEEREKCENYLLPGENENGDIFDWEETLKSDFTLEVRDKVKKHFQHEAEERGVSLLEATKATPARWCEWGCFMGATAWSFYTMLYSQSIFWSWVNMFLFPCMYWISAGMLHDGSHFAVSRDWRINLGMQYIYRVISSPYEWLHQHIIGHHPYTNIQDKDPDLNHSGGDMRFTDQTKWNIKHIKQENIYFILSLFALVGMNVKNSLMLIVTQKYNNVVYKIPIGMKYNILHLCDTLLYMYIFFIFPFKIWSPFYAIKHAILPYLLLSAIFIFNASINHTQSESIKSKNKNWYIHQVTTANNFGTHWPHYYTSIGLNYQIEHHLFPTVNHCHLRYIQPIVKSLCDKHGFPYHHTGGYKEAIQGVYQHVREMGKKPVEEVQN